MTRGVFLYNLLRIFALYREACFQNPKVVFLFYEYCRKRNKRKTLTLCGKTNVLTYAFDLWKRTFDELAAEYTDIKTEYMHVDATPMWFVKNPEWFDEQVEQQYPKQAGE